MLRVFQATSRVGMAAIRYRLFQCRSTTPLAQRSTAITWQPIQPAAHNEARMPPAAANCARPKTTPAPPAAEKSPPSSCYRQIDHCVLLHSSTTIPTVAQLLWQGSHAIDPARPRKKTSDNKPERIATRDLDTVGQLQHQQGNEHRRERIIQTIWPHITDQTTHCKTQPGTQYPGSLGNGIHGKDFRFRRVSLFETLVCTAKLSSVSSYAKAASSGLLHPLRLGESAADINMCRIFTMNVVIMIEIGEMPAENKPTAMNCDDPAYTNIDIASVCQTDRPAFCASTPKAKPIGIYPITIGNPSEAPRIHGCSFTNTIDFISG